MPLTYGSVCSGIEAATVAWEPLNWTPAWFAEIDPFCSAVLKYRYPSVPNLGDFTKIGATSAPPQPAIDLLVGGTPCQDFSVAGGRAGLGGADGQLALEYLALLGRLRPRWVVWENVPGVLSSLSHDAPNDIPPPDHLEAGEEWTVEEDYEADEGHDFWTFLSGLSALGYGVTYRVLDAQYAGLAQRRVRVFVVGHLGDWRPSAAVLLDRWSLHGHPAPRREAGESVAATIGRGPDGGFDATDYERAGAYDVGSGAGQVPIAPSQSRTPLLFSETGKGWWTDDGSARLRASAAGSPENLVVSPSYGFTLGAGAQAGSRGFQPEQAPTLRSAEGGNMPAVLCFDPTQVTSKGNYSQPRAGDMGHPLSAGAHPAVIAFSWKDGGQDATEDLSPTLRVGTGHLEHSGGASTAAVLQGLTVRRMTPLEYERCFGFPDNWTLVPYRGRLATDTPRYRALGNSISVPDLRYIAERIEFVESVLAEQRRAA